mmetsp:Transcript_1446/g.3386  ORF Transcript_1446/g.3386 Transcript_1446/m.3386 type:complete len:361 (-) Transcript_1446:197-1279(-)
MKSAKVRRLLERSSIWKVDFFPRAMYMRAHSCGSRVAANCALASSSAVARSASRSVSQKPAPTERIAAHVSGGGWLPTSPVRRCMEAVAAPTSSRWLLLCIAHRAASRPRPGRRPALCSHAARLLASAAAAGESVSSLKESTLVVLPWEARPDASRPRDFPRERGQRFEALPGVLVPEEAPRPPGSRPRSAEGAVPPNSPEDVAPRLAATRSMAPEGGLRAEDGGREGGRPRAEGAECLCCCFFSDAPPPSGCPGCRHDSTSRPAKRMPGRSRLYLCCRAPSSRASAPSKPPTRALQASGSRLPSTDSCFAIAASSPSSSTFRPRTAAAAPRATAARSFASLAAASLFARMPNFSLGAAA